jgi:serine/threonine-protein kinase
MAEVFKARAVGSAGFARDVVVKRLHAFNSADPEFVSMFTDEARILGTLHHPNVVQALDFYREEDHLCLVLEYVEGPALSRICREGREVPPAVAAYIGREVCRALEYIHGFRGADGEPSPIIHRDVTPSNIIVTPAGGVKLLDFGIAKTASPTHLTKVGTVKGKPSYLAPEQLQTGQVRWAIDGRVDIFALGIVLHELLTGERLFRGENDLETVRQILEKKIPKPSTRRADVPAALDAIVMKALEREPSDRYQSAAAMARDLDEVVLSARLRVDEVAAFARDVEAPVRKAAPRRRDALVRVEEHAAPTRRDLRLPMSMWMNALPGGRRTALVAGLGFALGVGSLGVGRKLLTPRATTRTPERTAALICPPPAGAPLVSTATPF